MRRHNYRAWNPVAQKMFYGREAFIFHGDNGFEAKVMWQGQDVDQILLESASYFDINQREIFEGDVLEVRKLHFNSSGPLPDKLTVVWHYGAFELWRGDTPLMGLRVYDVKECVVLGNIFENPELA